MRALLAVLALIAATGLAACGSGSGPPARPSAPAREVFGASVNRLFNDRVYSGAQITTQLQALSQTGASVARSDTLWEATETAPPVNGRHRYDWRFDDQVAGSLASSHLRWFPVLDYSAAWAQIVPGILHSAPNPAAFAAFASAFAARYGRGGQFWRLHPDLPTIPVDTYEVWNEPDNPRFWAPRPDAAAYASLYSQTRNAIRSADPDARVIVGGLTRPEQFLPALIADAPTLKGSIDGVAIHPYGSTPGKVLDQVRGARSILRTLGLGGAPLYVTEVGWTTSPRSSRYWAPPDRRPLYLRQTLTALGHSNCDLAAVFVYTWITPEQHPLDQEDWFGIHPLDGSESADSAAFTSGLRLASAAAGQLPIC